MRHTQPSSRLNPTKRSRRLLLHFHYIVRAPGMFPVIAFLPGIRYVPNLGSASCRRVTVSQSRFLIFSAPRGPKMTASLEEP